MRHKIHAIRPGTTESRSKFELNVPAGAFVSPQHAWVGIQLNGAVRIGLDDLLRKIFGQIDRVDLPEPGKHVAKGETLFTVTYGDYSLDIPSPISGRISAVNQEQAEHPEWLAIKPFELSWMCSIDPTHLATELLDLRIGQDAIDWYQQELDRYSSLDDKTRTTESPDEAAAAGKVEQEDETKRRHLLAGFSKPFMQGGGS
jgi:glycine cleavage system H protein